MRIGNFTFWTKFVFCLLGIALSLSACIISVPQSTKKPSPSVAIATNNILPTAIPFVEKTVTSSPPSNRIVQTDTKFWQTQTLDLGSKVGAFSSIQVDQNNHIYLAYLDDEHDNLKTAIFSDGKWGITSTASKAKDGFFPSLALDRQSNKHISEYNADSRTILFGTLDEKGWRFEKAVQDVDAGAISLLFDLNDQPVILFYDKNTRNLSYATKISDQWLTQEIGVADGVSRTIPAGFGADKRFHIVYQSKAVGLVYATLTGSDNWQTQLIDAESTSIVSPALAFDPAGLPNISYYDSRLKILKYAHFMSGKWETSVVDNSPGVGNTSSIAVDRSNHIHISYYDETNKSLKYAYRTDDQWQISIVESRVKIGKNISMALDSNGNPHISYYDSEKQVLRYAFIVVYDTGQKKLSATYLNGQTFLTWKERNDLQGEIYRAYRSNEPITPSNFGKARLLGEVGESASRFYANYHDEGDGIRWNPRYSDNLIINNGGVPLPDHVGLLVWTLSAEDLNGGKKGAGYYAVTVTPSGGQEALSSQYVVGPVTEKVEDPLPVEISHTPGIYTGPNRHVYIQYMDLSQWNPTFHAPNETNHYYGFDITTPGIAHALQYFYDYIVFAPSAKDCNGKIPENLPIYVFLHGSRGNRYGDITQNPYPNCAYGIFPVDVTETWYFGFARNYDYRKNGGVAAGDVIVNYTEQRILRMVYDLIRNPPGPKVDEQRIYIFGHSMGGSGALAFAERYSNVFAAAYSGQPVTNYLSADAKHKSWEKNVVDKWGKPELNLPISISGPNGWADHLQKYNGIGVWSWQDYRTAISSLTGEDMVPLGIDHGKPDDVINWSTQGEPFYAKFVNSKQAWGGLVNDAGHQWSNFVGLLPALGNSEKYAPFWNFKIVKNETVPGISNESNNPFVLSGVDELYNHSIMWSSSWNSWDGTPIDQPDLWRMSLCSVTLESGKCGTGPSLKVDITPRRLQKFMILPGKQYDWQNEQISNGVITSSGMVTADEKGLLTIVGFQVLPDGNRLVIKPHNN